MLYIQQSDIETYLGITLTANGVALFNLLQQPMQDIVDQYCNRTWNFTNPVTENFDALSADGKFLLANYTFFPKYKVSSTVNDANYPLAGGIISVKVGTSLLDMNYVVNYGTHIKFSASFPSVILANPLGFKMVTIQYNSDDAGTVPTPVKYALIQWMAREMQNAPDAGKEPVNVQTGPVKVEFSGARGLTPLVMPPLVKQVLDQYRLPALDHL